jgi:translation initiation factor IF-2
MIIKYRIHEVAKDFNVSSKVLLELFANSGGAHNHMTTLTEEELNIAFEFFTQNHQVEKFDEYFAMQAKPGEPKPVKVSPPTENIEETVAPKLEPPVVTQDKAEEKPISNAKPQQPAQNQQQGQYNQDRRPQQQQGGFQQGQRTYQNQPQQGQRSGGQQQRPYQPQNQGQGQRPPQQGFNQLPRPNLNKPTIQIGQQPASNRHISDRTQVRHVDTRGVQVDLAKYDERFGAMVPDSAANMWQGKQKIKQKSQDRRPMGTKRDSEHDKLKKLELEKARRQQLKVSIPDEIAVGELAIRLKVTASEVIKKLMVLGTMAAISDMIDYETAALVAMELGAKVEHEVLVTLEERLIDQSEDIDENLETRSPVVVVMGHVDHGKTSLLDAIRDTNVVSGEAGGITQHIGAYKVNINDRDITFLDTPGHAAFTSMRARGAQVTDIAILVVAADDGIMPQTVEAIDHAKAAGVSIIVAINKIDKPGANVDKVKQELTEYGLVTEEWGGDTICVPVSAKEHQNIDQLLEMILIVADMKELKANPNRAAKGTVIEARLDKGRGPIATVLVQNGTLRVGDIIIAGSTVGRIRAMNDHRGRKATEAGPSVPIEIIGLSEVPGAGDIFHAVEDERMARDLVSQRKQEVKDEQFSNLHKVTLDNLFTSIKDGEMKELNIIVKADVQGSVEAVKQSLEKITNEEVRVRVIHGGVGAITESDIMLASASKAIIVGFNVRPDKNAEESLATSDVEVRLYSIIYDCIEEIKSAMKGMLAPKIREVILGRAEARQTFRVPGAGTIAGCYILDGKVTRNGLIRVIRDGIVLVEDKISSLKRFKDDVKEVVQGYECGIGLEKYNDIKEGDIMESFIMEEYRED